MAPINVLLTGLPGTTTTQRLLVSDTSIGLPAAMLHTIICGATGLPDASFYLLSNGRRATGTTLLAPPGDGTAFVHLAMRRALPGGKGGFGATIRGKAGGVRTHNFGACRDLHGRRLGDVQDEQRLRTFLAQADAQTPTPGEQPPRAQRKRGRRSLDDAPDRAAAQDCEQVAVGMRRNADDVADAVAAGLGRLGAARKKTRVGVKTFEWMNGFEPLWPSGSESSEGGGKD